MRPTSEACPMSARVATARQPEHWFEIAAGVTPGHSTNAPFALGSDLADRELQVLKNAAGGGVQSGGGWESPHEDEKTGRGGLELPPISRPEHHAIPIAGLTPGRHSRSNTARLRRG